jgi:hypothetical protein
VTTTFSVRVPKKYVGLPFEDLLNDCAFGHRGIPVIS